MSWIFQFELEFRLSDILDDIYDDCVAVDILCLILLPEKQIHVASN